VTKQEAIEKARSYFLTEDNIYGCAETTCIVLQEVFDLPNGTDSSPAMVLNGGVAWRGGICGAISGAAIAVGRLAEQRVVGHKNAKRTARRVIDRFIDEFQTAQGTFIPMNSTPSLSKVGSGAMSACARLSLPFINCSLSTMSIPGNRRSANLTPTAKSYDARRDHCAV